MIRMKCYIKIVFIYVHMLTHTQCYHSKTFTGTQSLRDDVLTLLSSGTPLMTMSLEYSRLQLLLMFSGGFHVQFRVQIWINE